MSRVRHPTVVAVLALAATPASALAAPDIFTFAGTGTAGFAGDGGPGGSAGLSSPRGMTLMADGSILVADAANHRIRRITSTGTISTVAGTGTLGSIGDGGPAVSAQLNFPRAVAATADGGYLIADMGNNRIRRVASNGTISPAAGTGTASSTGDGGNAVLATLNVPSDLAVMADGGYLIVETSGNRIRRVSSAGVISTVAGTGVASSTGDGGPAVPATMNGPLGVAALPDGGYLIAEGTGNRIRRVSASGTITTVAGTGTACAAATGLCGDFGPAALAQLSGPTNVIPNAAGDGYWISDSGLHRIRYVSASNIITTVVGSGSQCATATALCGDGGAGTSALLNTPRFVLPLPDGSLVVSDNGINRIRKVAASSAGSPGPTGATGLAGVAGAAGAQGPSGPAGSAGTQGAKGDTGATGRSGRASSGRSTTATAPLSIIAAAPDRVVPDRSFRVSLRLSRAATVTVRIHRDGTVFATRTVRYKASGRKGINLRIKESGRYTVTVTATAGASADRDTFPLRVSWT